MKTRPLKNYDSSLGVEVYDIDLNSDSEILELGKLVADQCIVYIDQPVTTQRLYGIMNQWGEDSRALIHNYVLGKKLTGRHWREIMLNLGFLTRGLGDLAGAVSRVSYQLDEKGNPEGLFPQGELDWHADQISRDDSQRIIGLHSISGSANSQTQFLCTHDAFESFSSDMRSMIKELVCKHKWRTGEEGFCPGMNQKQERALRYNSLPMDGMETRLYAETVTGRSGIKLPHHSFDGFVGMGMEESNRVIQEIENKIYQDRYVYTQDWQDGQVVFMDQEITLHKRPTNLSHGNKRVMARVITYLNYLFPEKQPTTTVRYKGEILTHDEFAALVDQERKQTFEQFETETA
jgi:alpha-ketoglutarate-dependent taurine dioxygenase